MVCRLTRLVDHAIQVAVGGGDLRLFAAGSTGTTQNQQKQTNAVIVAELANTHKQQQQRKRKERHESFNSQTQERKVIRSNSEERPLEEENTNNKDSIRRVSSHEDFSLVKGNGKKNKDINKHNKSFLSELIDPAMGHGVRASGLPLHERNLSTTGAYPSNTYGKPHVSGVAESETAVLQDNELFDDSEHERRRSTERFARAVAPRGRRNMARRRRTVHKAVKSSPEDNDGGGSSKENEDQEEITSRSHHQAPPPPPPTAHNSSEDEGVSSRSSSAHSFMQLHPQVARIERERSPSPVPSPCTPPLDLSTLHQQVDCSEPLTSHASWNLEGDEQEKLIANSRVMLSPRNSMILTRRVYLDPNVPPSPPQEHDAPSSLGVADAKIKQLSKQVHSMKKKLKKFEEEFELSHGYHPSHADKMANKEIKKLCTELNKFRKELKQLKENPSEVLLSGVGHSTSEEKLLPSKPATMEEIVQEVEKILRDKREATGRPEALDELTREQLLDEKVAMQKSLLHLEDAFGRPVTKSDRDLVRPLYDRYRMLKRMIIRTAPSKMKDSISELATIHEHETMDFTSSPSSLTGQEEMVTSEPHATEINGDPTLVSQMQLSGSSENLMENLHAMPLSELLSQQRSLREEKKCLRRTLREFEEDFQRRMGRKLQREDRIPMEGVYTSYKQAKAKLRLLEALVTKQT